ncbi:MAG: hypothetical protein HY815_07430 [Candidatus Riflebacteria bacterium]|nr:hypothetical protein [Candidatus Riflebacteria bacterium]
MSAEKTTNCCPVCSRIRFVTLWVVVVFPEEDGPVTMKSRIPRRPRNLAAVSRSCLSYSATDASTSSLKRPDSTHRLIPGMESVSIRRFQAEASSTSRSGYGTWEKSCSLSAPRRTHSRPAL